MSRVLGDNPRRTVSRAVVGDDDLERNHPLLSTESKELIAYGGCGI